MIYQFSSPADAVQFSELSSTHKKVFDFVGNHKFSFDGSYVVIAHKEDTLYLSNVELNSINNVLSQYCFAVDGMIKQESRDEKIQRLYQLILHGKYKGQDGECIHINDDVKIQFHNGSGGKGVGVYYKGSYDFSIFQKTEQLYLWEAYEQLKKNQIYQQKLDFFNSLKF